MKTVNFLAGATPNIGVGIRGEQNSSTEKLMIIRSKNILCFKKVRVNPD